MIEEPNLYDFKENIKSGSEEYLIRHFDEVYDFLDGRREYPDHILNDLVNLGFDLSQQGLFVTKDDQSELDPDTHESVYLLNIIFRHFYFYFQLFFLKERQTSGDIEYIVYDSGRYITIRKKGKGTILFMDTEDEPPNKKQKSMHVIIRPEYNEIRTSILETAPYIYQFVETFRNDEDSDDIKYIVHVIHKVEYSRKSEDEGNALSKASKAALDDLKMDIEEKLFVDPDEEESPEYKGKSNYKKLCSIIKKLHFVSGDYIDLPHVYCNGECTLFSLAKYRKVFIGDSLDDVYKKVETELPNIKKEALKKRKSRYSAEKHNAD